MAARGSCRAATSVRAGGTVCALGPAEGRGIWFVRGGAATGGLRVRAKKPT